METIKSKILSQHTNIIHAYTTRKTKDSIYGNNLAYHVNDDKKNVQKNHELCSKSLKYPLNRLIHMNQVHSDKIVTIKKEHDFHNIPTCDAVITKEKNIPLMVMVADCIPVLMYDPVHKVIAAVHAGRAGAFQKIVTKTIKKMNKEYQTRVEDLLIVLGPSIHQCCYEVGKEIKEEAKKLGVDYAIAKKDNTYYLDLISIIEKDLKKMGCKQEKIEISEYCTACNTEHFFSYRAEQNKCGRFAGVIMIK